MRRARLEGRHIGRNPLDLDHAAIQRDRCQGQSLRQILANSQDIEHSLQQQRRVLYDAHKRISTVTKGV
jgi:hypothetical protein